MTTPHPTGLVESRLLGDGHGRFGGRVRETDRVKARHRALTRSYSESLAFRLRPGNAGSNTAVDHIEVLDEAIAQLPARHRRNLLVTCDGAGATLDLIATSPRCNAAPGRRVHYSVGFDLDARGRTAISRLSETDWDQVLDHRGQPRDPDDAGVAELTGLLRRSVGGDRLANWPPDMRIICRRERPSSGAQLSLMEEADGWRYQLIATNTPTGQAQFLEARHRPHARVEDRIRTGKNTGIGHLPSTCRSSGNSLAGLSRNSLARG